MKNSGYLIILLALGLLLVSYKWISTESITPAPENGNSAYSNIMTRTSVRAYKDKEIGEAAEDSLLRAAMAAPTAGNKQPWRFVVVNERALLDSIGENFWSMKMAKTAPLAIVMCGEPKSSFEGEGMQYWVQDVSAASENLLLAAHSMGLGAVWCGIYPISERVEKFSQLLGLPAEITPMACICIGYPESANTPKDKWKPELIHYNKW